MSILETTDAVINALGGTVAVANLTGKAKSAVSMWRVRGRFPSDTFLMMTAALKALRDENNEHVTAPAALWGIREPGKRKRPSHPEGAAA